VKPLAHIAISGVGAGVIGFVSHNIGAALAFFVSGICVDIDHVFDYVASYDSSHWSMQHFLYCCSHNGLKKLRLLFHSFELLFIVWVLTVWNSWFSIVWMAFLAGFSLHLLLDHWTNGTPALFYFFFYRRKHRFQSRLLSAKEKCC